MSKNGEKTEKKISAKEITKILISTGMDKLWFLSRDIDELMVDPTRKNATVPDVRYYPPIFQPCPYVSWNIFRDGRKARSNPQGFGLAYIDTDDLRQIGCLKIIQDDCNDMIDFFKNVDTLSPLLAKSLISNISEIVGRYYYMTGYHGLKYLYEQTIRERGGKGGSQETRLKGIVAAVKKFKEKPNKKSKGDFIQFLSKKEYTRKTPYQISQYDLYVDDGLIYHRDRLKKNERRKINLRWDRPITISSLDRYYYEYVK
jgi:hypothetical protein